MPNWCDNTLTVRGSKSDVANFVNKAKGQTHNYVGPFNPKWDEENKFDWEGFTPVMMEILMNSAETFTHGVEQDLSFHTLYPVPKEVLLAPYDSHQLKVQTEKYPEWFSRFPDLIAGYDWENKNWGTKWGACETHIIRRTESLTEDESSVEYSFATAWSPAIDFFDKVSADFPTLTFQLEYSEPGMGFAGTIVWSDGHQDYHEDRECENEDEDEDDWEAEPENGQ